MGAPPPVVLRADAGSSVGLGHAMRLLALGETLRQMGGGVAFLGDVPALVRDRAQGADIRLHESRVQSPGDAADVEATLAVLRALDGRHGAPWLVVDGYDFPPTYHEAVSAAGFRQARYDDVGSPAGAVDVLVNQNAGAEGLSYPSAPDTVLLLGSRFAALRPRFNSQPPRQATSGRPTRVLVSFGGSESAMPALATTLGALESFPELDVIVVRPSTAGRSSAAADSAAIEPAAGVRTVVDVDDMAALLASCDLAVCAGGSTCWELARLGVPMVVITIAANQEIVARAIADAGAGIVLGDASQVTSRDITDAVAALLAEPARTSSMREAGRRLVDGKGAERIATVLSALTPPRVPEELVNVRAAEASDVEAIWRIGNDPVVRRNSFDRPEIPFDAHREWFARRLAADDSALLVLDVGGAVAAQVRYDHDGGDAATVHFAVAPGFRGRGLGTLALAATLDEARARLGIRLVRGFVLTSNVASAKAFLSAGYHEARQTTERGFPCLVFERELA